jgi:hypothetical protein
MNQDQQRKFFYEFTRELDKMTLSWDAEIEEWYDQAIKAFEYERLNDIQLTEDGYGKIIEYLPEGLNYNAFAYLIKAVSKRNAREMGMDCRGFYNLLALNKKMAGYFEATVAPIRKRVEKRVEIMSSVNRSNHIK